MDSAARPSMVFTEKKEKETQNGSEHSIESALIQASSKGYTIDMILGTNDRRPKPKQEEAFEQESKLSRNSSDDEGKLNKPSPRSLSSWYYNLMTHLRQFTQGISMHSSSLFAERSANIAESFRWGANFVFKFQFPHPWIVKQRGNVYFAFNSNHKRRFLRARTMTNFRNWVLEQCAFWCSVRLPWFANLHAAEAKAMLEVFKCS